MTNKNKIIKDAEKIVESYWQHHEQMGKIWRDGEGWVEPENEQKPNERKPQTFQEWLEDQPRDTCPVSKAEYVLFWASVMAGGLVIAAMPVTWWIRLPVLLVSSVAFVVLTMVFTTGGRFDH